MCRPINRTVIGPRGHSLEVEEIRDFKRPSYYFHASI